MVRGMYIPQDPAVPYQTSLWSKDIPEPPIQRDLDSVDPLCGPYDSNDPGTAAAFADPRVGDFFVDMFHFRLLVIDTGPNDVVVAVSKPPQLVHTGRLMRIPRDLFDPQYFRFPPGSKASSITLISRNNALSSYLTPEVIATAEPMTDDEIKRLKFRSGFDN